jgi:ketosteroid isomerase-like protein
MQSKPELIQAIYGAFNRREIDAVLATMHPDVDWPNGMEGGRVHGIAKVRDYWTRQWSMINPRVEPLRIEDDEQGQTVVEVHQVVRDLSGNLLVDQIIHHTYTIRNGLIERMDIEP